MYGAIINIKIPVLIDLPNDTSSSIFDSRLALHMEHCPKEKSTKTSKNRKSKSQCFLCMISFIFDTANLANSN